MTLGPHLSLGRYLSYSLIAAILLTVLLDKPAYAAIDVTLSGDAARPGDEVLLRTDNHGDPNLYGFLGGRSMPVFLIAEADLSKLSESGAQVCGTSKQTRLGEMTWTNGVGLLTFKVPAVRPGLCDRLQRRYSCSGTLPTPSLAHKVAQLVLTSSSSSSLVTEAPSLPAIGTSAGHYTTAAIAIPPISVDEVE